MGGNLEERSCFLNVLNCIQYCKENDKIRNIGLVKDLGLCYYR